MDWSYGQDKMLSSLELLERSPKHVRHGWFYYYFCCCCKKT
uniref:Uncharacterized protein n=1 Tax=viral metagenome TaxID=1070528 RepID=A0A6C0D3J5_9ZZZZ